MSQYGAEGWGDMAAASIGCRSRSCSRSPRPRSTRGCFWSRSCAERDRCNRRVALGQGQAQAYTHSLTGSRLVFGPAND